MAREGSHLADAILVPAAAGAGRLDEELAAVAVYKVAVGGPFIPNSCRENRIGVFDATRVRDACFVRFTSMINYVYVYEQDARTQVYPELLEEVEVV